MRRAAIFITFLMLYIALSNNPKHTCRFDMCPYKGITVNQYPAQAECEEGTDCYYLDLLHLEYPNADYDFLDSTLFTPLNTTTNVTNN